MKNKLPIFPSPILPSIAICAALLLSSCGKQEAVGDVPSSEELAKQADAASAAIREEAAAADGKDAEPAIDSAAMTSYTNALRGFTVFVPKGWELDEAASDDNGNVYTNNDATMKIGWIENREDADFQAVVQAVEENGEAMSGSFANDNDYRSSGIEDGGKTMAQRLLRKPDGTMVSAKITYPSDQAEKMGAVAKQILDSLTLQ